MPVPAGMRITQRARVGQIYWCSFPEGAQPEFFTEHPVVVIRAARDLHDVCTVVPLTTRPQPVSPTVYQLSRSYNPADQGSRDSWAVCSHVYTVRQQRLRPFQLKGRQVVPKMDDIDFIGVSLGIQAAFKTLLAAAPPAPTMIVVPDVTTVAVMEATVSELVEVAVASPTVGVVVTEIVDVAVEVR